MSYERIRLSLDLRFPDGVDLLAELLVDGILSSDSPSQPLVISTLPEFRSEHEERIVESVLLAVTNWCERHAVVPVGDPSPAVRLLVAELMPDDGTEPTEIQLKKFRLLDEWAHRDSALESVRRVAEIGGLEREDLGTTWGLTAFPNSGIGLRVNVGNRLSADLRADGSLRIYLFGEQPDVREFDGIEIGEGFSAVDGSYSLVAQEGAATATVLSDPEVQTQNRRFVEAHGRKLSRSNWHNPLTEPLLDGSNSAGRTTY